MAPQNDRLNFSLVKNLCSWQKNDKKWSKNGHLWVINFQNVFFQNWKKNETEKYVIYVVAFDPIEIWTSLAPQKIVSTSVLWKILLQVTLLVQVFRQPKKIPAPNLAFQAFERFIGT
jgi:hypothetical protein